MPTYAYHCRACDNDFEVKQRFSDDPLTDCIICETEESVFRVIQPAGIVFKGSGWYVTDSRGSGSKKGTSSTTGVANKSDASDNGSSDNGSSKDSNGANGSTESSNATTTNSDTTKDSKSSSNGSGTKKAESA